MVSSFQLKQLNLYCAGNKILQASFQHDEQFKKNRHFYISEQKTQFFVLSIKKTQINEKSK